MISDHVESNMTPISDFTNCNANHCPYSILHDFGPCRIEYTYFVMTPRATPTPDGCDCDGEGDEIAKVTAGCGDSGGSDSDGNGDSDGDGDNDNNQTTIN
jgi:hypothetical protein